jgi:hypothetical protein
MAETIQITKQEYSKLIATKGKYKTLKSDYKSLESDYASLVSEHHKVNKLQVKVTMLETKLKNYSKLLEYTNFSRRRFRTQATKPNEYHIKNMYGTLELELQQQLHEMGEYQYDQSDDEVVESNSEDAYADGVDSEESEEEPDSHTITLRDYTDKLSENFSKSFNERLKRVCNNENKTKTNLKERTPSSKTLEMTVQRVQDDILVLKVEYISSQSFREIEETQIINPKQYTNRELVVWLSKYE